MVITTGAAISDKDRGRDAEARAIAQVELTALESFEFVAIFWLPFAVVQSVILRP